MGLALGPVAPGIEAGLRDARSAGETVLALEDNAAMRQIVLRQLTELDA